MKLLKKSKWVVFIQVGAVKNLPLLERNSILPRVFVAKKNWTKKLVQLKLTT
jgi:hypothetical protein